MPSDPPLLMIPGPIEISPAVRASFGVAPPSHLAPRLLEAFGASLQMMREVWVAGSSSRPFVVAGGGTLAMEMAVANLMEPGDRAVVVDTGYFSARLAEMLRRAGVEVRQIGGEVGEVPSEARVREAMLEQGGRARVKALFATHVDTSTGVRLDPEPLARLARDCNALSVFDGVCAAAGERFEMEPWGADVYLTASQKAIGLPPGLALMVAGPRALETRAARSAPGPAMYLDWLQWLPVMEAYEEGRPSYFSTPATNLILALEVGLREILEDGVSERWARHEHAARAMRAAWRALGLNEVPARPEIAASTLSALRYPPGIDVSVVKRIAEQGVVVAGGLHPAIRDSYFRVGHMGYAAYRPEMLLRTVEAIGAALRDAGASVDPRGAVTAARAVLG